MSEDSSEAHIHPEISSKKPSRFNWPVLRKPKPAKNFGGPARVVVTALLIFIFSQLIAAVLVSLLLKISGSDTSLSELDLSTPEQFLYVFFAEAAVVLFVFRVLKRRGLKSAAIGFGRLPRWGDLGRALLGFGAFYLLLIAAGVLIAQFLPGLDTEAKQDVGFQNLVSSADRTLAFIALVILPPIGEEILVRGYLYSGLRSKLRFLPSMLITSVIFAAAHLQTGSGAALLWAAAINTFILSIVLVYLRERTGAIYSSIIVHGLNNLVAFGVYFHALMI